MVAKEIPRMFFNCFHEFAKMPFLNRLSFRRAQVKVQRARRTQTSRVIVEVPMIADHSLRAREIRSSRVEAREGEKEEKPENEQETT